MSHDITQKLFQRNIRKTMVPAVVASPSFRLDMALHPLLHKYNFYLMHLVTREYWKTALYMTSHEGAIHWIMSTFPVFCVHYHKKQVVDFLLVRSPINHQLETNFKWPLSMLSSMIEFFFLATIPSKCRAPASGCFENSVQLIHPASLQNFQSQVCRPDQLNLQYPDQL